MGRINPAADCCVAPRRWCADVPSRPLPPSPFYQLAVSPTRVPVFPHLPVLALSLLAKLITRGRPKAWRFLFPSLLHRCVPSRPHAFPDEPHLTTGASLHHTHTLGIIPSLRYLIIQSGQNFLQSAVAAAHSWCSPPAAMAFVNGTEFAAVHDPRIVSAPHQNVNT